ncbi:MAG: penicillin-binding protein activator LpoB [Kordiimonas sp.]
MINIDFFSTFKVRRTVEVTLLASSLAACGPTVINSAGVAPVSQDPSRAGAVQGVGIEGHDIQAMTDLMVRDMLSSPVLADATHPPQVIVDSGYFLNDSMQRINKDLITNRLRVHLNRAAMGRMSFINRAYQNMVAEERALKRKGMVDSGTREAAQAQAGGDFRLAGTIASADSRDVRTGMLQRYTQITFEMVDTERNIVVWSNMYELSKAAADDIVYR